MPFQTDTKSTQIFGTNDIEVEQAPKIFGTDDELAQEEDYGSQLIGALSRGSMSLGQAITSFPEHLTRQLKSFNTGMTMLGHQFLGKSEEETLKAMKETEDIGDNIIDVLKVPGRLHKAGQAVIEKNHPEWAYEPPENFKDLLTHPGKALLAIAESTPLLVAAGILTAAGAPQLSVGLMYAAEGQGAYDQAIADGQSEGTAEVSYVTYGLVAAALEQMQLEGIMKIGKGAFTHVLNRTTQKVAKQGVKSLTKEIIKIAASEALEEMAQGAWGEATAGIVYGKDVPGGLGGFIDRRLQEGLIGGLMGVIPGLGGAGGAALKTSMAKLVLSSDSNYVNLEDTKQAIEESPNLTPEQKEERVQYIGDIQTKVEKSLIKRTPDITDITSLQEVGNSIAQALGVEADIEWEFSNRKVKTLRGTHFVTDIDANKHTITVNRKYYRDTNDHSPATQQGMKETIIHELGHIAKPPIYATPVQSLPEGSTVKQSVEKGIWEINIPTDIGMQTYRVKSKNAVEAETTYRIWVAAKSGRKNNHYPEFESWVEQAISDSYKTKKIPAETLAPVREAETVEEPPVEKPPTEDIAEGEEPQSFEDKLANLLEQAKPVLEGQKEVRAKEHGIRANEARNILKSGKDKKYLYMAKRALKGAYNNAVFDPIMDFFTEEEIENARWKIRSNEKLLDFEAINTEDALDKALLGQLLADHEIRLLEKQFGEKVGKILMKRRTAGKKAITVAADLMNLPRTLLASMDLSAIGRQGLMLAPSHRKAWAKSIATGYKVLFSTDSLKIAEQMETDIKTGKFAERAIKSGLELTEWSGIGRSWNKFEEQFMSTLAERIPGIGRLVKRSERAYVTGLNKLRMDVFSEIAEEWEGTERTAQDYKDLASVINHLTGRGDVGSLEKLAPFLNAAFFSPRFFSSRIQVPLDLFTKSKANRMIVAHQLVSFVGTGIGILGLLSLIPGVDVEKDPRSSDFGKIRIGQTRIDFWVGYTPIVRLVTQLITGERKATDTGRVYDVDAGESILRFIRSKLAPVPGRVVDWATGETFIGEKVRGTPGSIGKLTYESLVPLALQDMVDSIRYQGLKGGLIVAPLAFHGIGAQTYPVTKGKESYLLKDKLAMNVYGEKWDELGSNAQKLLRFSKPQIGIAEAQAKLERESYSFIARMLEEQQGAGKAIQKQLPKIVQSELQRLSLGVGGLSKKIGSNWYLNDKNYDSYQKNYYTILNKFLPKLINNSRWNKLSEEQQRLLLTQAITTCKKFVRQELVNKVNRDDLITLKENRDGR